MKTVTIFTGQPSTGKTKKAQDIANMYKPDEVLQFLPSKKNEAKKSTRLIIFDDLNKKEVLDTLAVIKQSISHGFEYDRFKPERSVIFPQYLLITQSEITNEDLQVSCLNTRQIEVVKFPLQDEKYESPASWLIYHAAHTTPATVEA